MVDYLIQFDLNIYAIFLLILLFVVIKVKRDIFRFSTKLLTLILWTTVAVLIIEPLTWIFDNSGVAFDLFMNYLTNYLLILAAPILIGFWASYLDYKIHNDRKRLRHFHYHQFGTYIIALLCIINFFYPVFFYLNENFTYQTADLHWIKLVIVYFYFLYLVGMTYWNRKTIHNNVIFGVVAFFTIPITGSLIQLINPNLFFSWTMLAMSVVVVYIFLETTTGIRDYLTQLYSRRTLEDYMVNLMDSSRHFDVVMIDLNSFKAVNDHFGHHIGDQVLIHYAALLKEKFNDQLMVARFGGDEFFVVIESLNLVAIEKRILELLDQVKKEDFFIKYRLPGFSYGCAAFDGTTTLDEVFMQADARMYENKQISRQKKHS